MSFSLVASRGPSPERKRNIARGIVNAGVAITTPNGFATITGVGSLNKRACYELAISMDPTLPEAYFNLATTIKNSEVVEIGALKLNELECYKRACELAPQSSQSHTYFYNLGVSMRRSVKQVTLENGDVLTKKECYERSLALDQSQAHCWFNLAVALGEYDACYIVPIKRKYDEEENYGKHILQKQKELGEQEEEDEDDDNEIIMLQDIGCFIQALNLDDTIAPAWAMSGRRILKLSASDEAMANSHQLHLMLQEQEQLQNQKEQQEKKRRGEDENENNNINNNKRGEIDTDDEDEVPAPPPLTSILVKDKEYSASACFIRSLSLDDTQSGVWFLAGLCLPSDEASFFHSGRQMTKQLCFERSIELFPHRAVTWYELGCTLQRMKVPFGIISKHRMSPLQCFVKSAELADSSAVFFNIGALLDEKSSVEIEGELFDEQKCFETCLTLNDSTFTKNCKALAWFNLGVILGSSSSSSQEKQAMIESESYSREMCFTQAISLDPSHKPSLLALGRLLDNKDFPSLQSVAASGNSSFSSGSFSPQSSNNNYSSPSPIRKQNSSSSPPTAATAATQKLSSVSACAALQDEDESLSFAFCKIESTGECLDAKICFERALELDDRDVGAWRRLARRLQIPNSTPAVIHGEVYSKEDCIKKISQLSGK